MGDRDANHTSSEQIHPMVWKKKCGSYRFSAKLKHRNSKSKTLTLRSRSGVGLKLHKCLDQHLSPYQIRT